ncbi:MAG: gamma carbonic anhydrase family protein [archaeon]|nr:gamma carbonic anhydrase family protein [archaeon]
MTIYAYGNRIPEIDPTAYIFPSADIIGKVKIGPKVFVGAGAVIRGDYCRIVIGAGSAVEENVTIHASKGKKVIIEENVIIGHAAMIHGCIIRKESVIGMNSTISNDAEIGEWAIISEGAVVRNRSKISPYMVAAGVPAKEIRKLSPQRITAWKVAKTIYQGLTDDYPKKLRKID